MDNKNFVKPNEPKPKVEKNVDTRLTRFRNKKPPVIKQTKTSMIRMLKANPILVSEDNDIDVVCTSIRNAELNVFSTNLLRKAHKPMIEVSKTSSVLKNDVRNNNKVTEISKLKSTIRRSLSDQDFGTIAKKHARKTLENSNKSNIQNSNKSNIQPVHNKNISTIINKTEERRMVTFKTPNVDRRRSVSFSTPITPISNKQTSTPYASIPKRTPRDLQRRLNNWLKLRGKSLASFHHLKCFNIRQQHTEENKENVEVVTARSESYENLNIQHDEEQHEKDQTPLEDLTNLDEVANDALNDLHKLILEGYHQEQCEAWLKLIGEKYQQVEEKPQYWECRAAIEQARGNITSAVEYYRTAIIQGAEVNKVDQSLEHLLQKFSLLNISTSNSDETDVQNDMKNRKKIILDARHAFKSTIIQFAIQERAIKKNEKESTASSKIVATPVRRSTRQSMSKYRSTPSIQICASLCDLDESVREHLEFQGNKALSIRYKCE